MKARAIRSRLFGFFLSLSWLIPLLTSNAAIRYVDAGSAAPDPPYSSWSTAAVTIQDAIDVSTANDEIVVTNGTYAAGGRALSGTMTNRVSITNSIYLHSVNGPAATTIQGRQLPGITNGDGAIRCVLIAGSAALSGFTLTQGATRTNGTYVFEMSGGGLWISGGVVSNCVLAGNASGGSGGGAYQAGASGLLKNCVLANNFCSSLVSSNFGGGANYCTLIDCTVTNNRAPSGGGLGVCLANNCIIIGNSATNGGGAAFGNITNCTVEGNIAGSGGGTYNVNVYSCNLSGNSATDGGGGYGGAFVDSTVTGNFATNGGGAYSSFALRSTISSNSAANAGGVFGGILALSYITGNWSTNFGGGMYGGTATSCLFAGNVATNGGGVYTGTLTNCTISGNSAINGGGANSATLQNCIVYFNSAASGPNYSGGSFDHCDLTPLPGSGSGNISGDPLFVNAAAGNYHLQTNSPCVDAGNNACMCGGVDLDGNPRFNGTVDIGAYETQTPQPPVRPSIVVQPADVNVTEGSNATFTVTASGTVPLHYQWSENTLPLTGATNDSLTLTNVQLGQSGNYYSVLITNSAGSTNSTNAYLTVNPAPVHATHYVNATGFNPVFPYTSWATAAMTIQQAIDAALPGDEIIVTNGTYSTGTRPGPDSVPNRVMVGKALNVRSVNGAAFTIIQGYRGPIATNYSDGIRCVYLTNGASLSGFTLTNGAANNLGGGLYCEGGNVSVSNCVLVGNAAAASGGGAYQSTLYNCTLMGNLATNNGSSGGGAIYSTLNNCTVATNVAAYSGGGAYYSVFNNCIISGNSAVDGGGVYDGWLTNCLLSGNWAMDSGGGAYSANLYNCTLVGNSATNSGGGGYGFDSFHIHANCTLYNSIIYSNMAALAAECECTQYDCCSSENGFGDGNITGPPLFVDQAGGDFRLTAGSPCIDAGDNSFISIGTDLDGNPRIRNGIVDMGAYEFQTGSSSQTPTLGIATSGQSMTLSWPLWASNFVLEEISAVSSTAWSTNYGIPAVTNNENVLTVPVGSTAKFYRLFKP